MNNCSFSWSNSIFLTALAVTLFSFPTDVFAQTEENYAILAGTTITNTGATTVTGDVGVSSGTAITGFPPGIVIGSIQAGNATALQAQTDLNGSYNAATATPCTTDLSGQDLGGMTLTPGIYCFSAAANQPGNLTLNFQGNPNAVFLFKTGSTLTTAASSSVILTNTGGTTCPANVTWRVGSSATLGAGSAFVGDLLAFTSVTLGATTTIAGSALARNGAVTMDTNQVTRCAVAGAVTPAPVPTMSEWAIILLGITLAGGAALYVQRRKYVA